MGENNEMNLHIKTKISYQSRNPPFERHFDLVA